MEEGLTLHKEKKEWRDMFTTPLLEKALAITRIAEIDLDDSDELVTATIRSKREFHVAISRAPASYDEEWNPDNFTCDCMTKTRVRIWRLGQYSYHYVCQHMAAALLFWEKKHGPWYFPEPEERRLAREEARRAAREAVERKRREEAERARIRQEQEERKRALEEEREKLTAIFRPAGDFFPEPTPGDIFFDIKSITARANCNEYIFRRAHELLRTECITMNDPSITYSPRGEQMLNCAASVEDGDRSYSCRVAFTAHELVECRCHCNPSGWFYQKADSICEHTLVLLTRLREYVAVNNPGDYTDEAAAEFFAAMERPAALEEQNAAQQQEREPRIVLAPRLILDGGEASLSYRVGYAGSKLLNLRSYADFLRALEARESYAASKTLSLDFSQYTLTPESEPWLTFLQRRMSEVETANDQLARRSNYYYGESGTLKLKTKDLLTGAMLDRFYEQAEGQMVPLQDNASKKEYDIRVGHAALRVQLTTSRLKNRAGKLAGVSVTGQMPNILPGSAGSYMLNRQSLSRITREEADFLKPFRIASDEGGHISFRVGREKLAEFYYRTVPRFLETDWLEFEDTCAEEVENLLPPEPVFTFRLDRDAEAGLLTCEALVVYGDGEPIRLPDDTADGLRDRVQEKRVLELVQSYYPKLEGRRGCFLLS
ncbi:MAG: SNF2 helicase associated domain-containing protein, partial [bacterium]